MKSPRGILLVAAAALVLLLASPASAFASVPVGRAPYAVLANPAAHEIYVANMLSNDITVIDSTSDEVTATISVLNGAGIAAPVALAHNPNTGKLYCVNFWSGQLAVVSLPSKTVEAYIPVGYSHSNARAAVVNPVTSLVYVTNLSQGLVYVIDGNPSSPTYNTILGQIPVGLYPRSLALNTTLSRLYVVNTSSNSVSVIDVDPLSTNYNKVVATVVAGWEPYAIAVNHNTAKVYVANRRFGTVTVIDGLTNSVRATVVVGAFPRALDVNTERNLVFCANQNSANVTVIDGAGDTVKATVPAGTKPYAVAGIGTVEGNTYVANYGNSVSNSTVTVIAPDFSKTETQAGVGPASLSIDNMLPKPKVYVGNYASNDVTVIDPDFGSTSLVSTIDPLPHDTATTPTPMLTGSSTSLARPFAGRIMKVYWRLDEESAWNNAQITSGWGSSSVRWEARVQSPLSPGEHRLEVLAMDMTGATLVSSDGFAAATPRVGSRASYGFTFGRPLGSISGSLFDDADGDGTFDAGEQGIAGAEIAVRGTVGDLSAGKNVVTDQDGNFIAEDLEEATYSLGYAPPALNVDAAGEVLEPGSYVTLAPGPIDLEAGEDVTGADFGAARYGWIQGQVKDEYTSEPQLGALIELPGAGRTALTGENGKFFFYEIPANGTASAPFDAYSLSLRLPSGRLSHESLVKAARVVQGSGAVVDWTVYREDWASGLGPNGIGYWKNWRNHYTETEMTLFLASARSASGLFDRLTPAQVADFLSFKGKTPMSRKAEAQLLVSWLNVVSGRLGVDVVLDPVKSARYAAALDVPERVRVDTLLARAGLLVGQGSSSQLEALKDVLEQMNERLLF